MEIWLFATKTVHFYFNIYLGRHLKRDIRIDYEYIGIIYLFRFTSYMIVSERKMDCT